MTDTFTPGPWSVNERGGQTIRVDIVSHADDLPFTPSFVAGDILPADARLIAAAPAMLEALELALEEIRQYHADEDCKGGCPAQEALTAGRAAIAQARGEQVGTEAR